MLNINLSEKTKKNLVYNTGMTYDEVVALDPDDESMVLGKKTVYSKKRDLRKTGRGNPLLAHKRIMTIDEVNKRLGEIN